MDELTPFEQQLSVRFERLMGPVQPVDDAAVYQRIGVASHAREWRFGSAFSATKVVAAGVIVALFGSVLVLGLRLDRHDEQAPAAAAASVASASPSAEGHRHPLNVDGIGLSFVHRDTEWGWEGFDGLKDGVYMSVSTHGPQMAEVMIMWTTFPHGEHARPCLLDPSATSAAELARSAATAPGVEVLGPPTSLMIDGHPAMRVVVAPKHLVHWGPSGRMAAATLSPEERQRDDILQDGEDVGCLPGFFFAWEPLDGGAIWTGAHPGDTIQLWGVEVEGKLLVIEAATHSDAGPDAEQSIAAIIDSIRFD